jgi:hypothetical protein
MIPEIRSWYNEFRTREFGWSWYKENDISWIEVIHLLQNIYDGIELDNSKLFLLRDIGFLTEDLHVNLKGKSVFQTQTARDRRYITFAGKELHHE